MPRTRVPRGLELRLIDRIDGRMGAVLLVSLAVHLGGFAYFKYARAEAIPEDEPIREAWQALPQAAPAPLIRPTTPAATPLPPATPPRTDPGPGRAGGEGHGNGHVARSVGGSGGPAGPPPVLAILSGKKNGTGGIPLDPGVGLENGLVNVGRDRVAIGGDVPGAAPSFTPGVIAPAPDGPPIPTPKGPGRTGSGIDESPTAAPPASAAPSPAPAPGVPDPERIAEIVRDASASRAFRCYERVAKTRPDLGGKVLLELSLGVDGRVKDVVVAGFDDDIDRCIDNDARAWRFPRLAQAATFELTLILRNGTTSVSR
jgi:hypothetical protein